MFLKKKNFNIFLIIIFQFYSLQRFSFTQSNNSGSNRGSSSGSANGVALAANRSSFGNGSYISSSTATISATQNKRQKSKTTKCFSSTVFRCCIPCRGGGSAGPAASPPHTPVSQTTGGRGEHLQQQIKKTDGLEENYEETEELINSNSKKHSLADTIGTSATTPLSLKNLLAEVDSEENCHTKPLSAADIAAASLATGLFARKAEPETLSDTSVSPSAAEVLHANVSTTNSLLTLTSTATATTNSTVKSPSSSTIEEDTVLHNIQTLNTEINLEDNFGLNSASSSSSAAALNVNTAVSATTQTSATNTNTPPRCCCQPQTSPLPHIKEEEESENHQQQQQQQQQQHLHAHLQPAESNKSQQQQQLQSSTTDIECKNCSETNTNTNTYSGSSDSVHHSSGTSSATSAAAATPSPRIKLKFRKQLKSGWSRTILTPGGGSGIATNSNETLTSLGSNTNNTSSRLTSSSASALVPHQNSNSATQLLPTGKMQAEQGSIGDLQKYHSRYLKNRRHTLANVR